MKHIFNFSVLALGLLLAMGCKSQSGAQESDNLADAPVSSQKVWPTDPDLGEPLTRKYLEDAARLATRDALTREKGPNEAAIVNTEAQARYFKDLKAVWMFANNEQEAAPNLEAIHTFPNPNLHEMLVTLEKDAPFAKNWKVKNIVTGNPKLDALAKEYALEVKSYREGSLGGSAVLYSPYNLVIPFLGEEMAQFEGIRFAEAQSPMGDGNNIESVPGGKNARGLRFSEAWGDCPSGCIHRRFYTYYINPDGSVYYVGASGDEKDEE